MSGKIRVGVLSAGAWSVATHIPELLRHEDVELVVVTNQSADTASRIKEEFGFQLSSDSWRFALQQQLDAVIVSSPPIAHEEMVIASLQSGAHVLCEKPFALNGESAQAMYSTALSSNRRLLVGYGWAYSDIFIRTKELLKQSIVGSPEFVTMGITSSIRELLQGQSTLDWSSKGILSETRTYQDPKVAGGGAIGTTLSHSLGLLIHFMGEGFDWIFGSSYPPGDALDYHESVSGRLKGGAAVNMYCTSTFGSSPNPTWRFEVYGAKGELRVDTLQGEIRYYGREGDEWIEKFDEAGRGYKSGKPTALLLECARGNDIPEGCDSSIGVKVVRASDGLYESFFNGQRNSVR